MATKKEKKELKTQEIFNALTDEQKETLYSIIGKAALKEQTRHYITKAEMIFLDELAEDQKEKVKALISFYVKINPFDYIDKNSEYKGKVAE